MACHTINISVCLPLAVDGAWGAWMGWSVCTVSCGGGTRVRSRNCDNPAPAHSGLTCSGSAQEAADCNAQQCRGNAINKCRGKLTHSTVEVM